MEVDMRVKVRGWMEALVSGSVGLLAEKSGRRKRRESVVRRKRELELHRGTNAPEDARA